MEGGRAGGALLSPTHTAVPRPQCGLHGNSCLANRLLVNDRARPRCQLGAASRRVLPPQLPAEPSAPRGKPGNYSAP